MSDIKNKKREFRQIARKKRDSLTKLTRATQERHIFKNLYHLYRQNNFFNKSQAVYLAYGSEVSLFHWIRYRCTKQLTLFPKIDKDNNMLFVPSYAHGKFQKNKLQILEPTCFAKVRANIVLLPLVAASKNGYRLGQGGGFYDRYLSKYGMHSIKVGVAFSQQVFDNMPTEIHDVKLNWLVTDKSIMSF